MIYCRILILYRYPRLFIHPYTMGECRSDVSRLKINQLELALTHGFIETRLQTVAS